MNCRLLDKCNRLQASLRLAEQCQTELEATKRVRLIFNELSLICNEASFALQELEVLRSAKEEDDRAIADLVGHHNHRQKVGSTLFYYVDIPLFNAVLLGHS